VDQELIDASQHSAAPTDLEMMAALLGGVEGDTDAQVSETGVPAADPVETVQPVVAATAAPAAPAAPDPVLMAKDGVHTIPYERLLEARDSAKRSDAANVALTAEIEALKRAPAPTPAAAVAPSTPAPATALDADVFGDYSEEALAKGLSTLVDVKVAAIKADLKAEFASTLAPMQAKVATDAADAHYRPIYTAHPDVESVVQSAEMKAFIEAQPSYARPAIEQVLTQGNATQVIELLDQFKKSTGQPAAAAPVLNAAAKAASIVAQVKAPAPRSLSDIPASNSAHHDEGAAMQDMSVSGLMSMFDGKTPAQIETLMRRAL